MGNNKIGNKNSIQNRIELNQSLLSISDNCVSSLMYLKEDVSFEILLTCCFELFGSESPFIGPFKTVINKSSEEIVL